MASLFSNLFGGGKSTGNGGYTGTQPVTSLSQVQGGPEYYQTLQDRMAGRGVGYGDAYTSYANPQIAQLHNQYTGYQLPELQSELTAEGRRAGSGGFQQIARSQSDEADKENSIMAQLMQRNAEASHSDVNNAITGMGNYASENANLQGQAANFGMRNTENQTAQANMQDSKRAAGYQALIQAGAQALPGVAGLPGISSIPGMSAIGTASQVYDNNAGGVKNQLATRQLMAKMGLA